MLAKHEETSPSSIRVFSLLSTIWLATVVIANAGELPNDSSTTIVDGETNVSRSTLVAVGRGEDKAEARTKGETAHGVEPSTRSAEWSNRGPFVRGRDSYLEALRHSRTSTDPREGVVDAVDGTAASGTFQRRKEQSFGAAKRSELSLQTSPSDSYSMVASDSYSLPIRPYSDFSALRNSYGPPQTQPPRGTYGPPYNDHSSYGGEYVYSPQPQPQPAYGVPHVAYGAPHGITESVHLGFPSIDFSWPFALKLNAFTLAKILLKLVIFKMIVKFIAVICLLLFIPKLEIKKTIKKVNVQNNAQDDDDDEDEGRGLQNANWKVWDGLNLLTLAVNEALRQHEVTNGSRSSECSALECQVRRAFENDRSWPDYEQLLQNYIMEEARRLRIKS